MARDDVNNYRYKMYLPPSVRMNGITLPETLFRQQSYRHKVVFVFQVLVILFIPHFVSNKRTEGRGRLRLIGGFVSDLSHVWFLKTNNLNPKMKKGVAQRGTGC